ncbi:MAG: UbiA family prenyltransferase [Rhizorhabdus sp.]
MTVLQLRPHPAALAAMPPPPPRPLCVDLDGTLVRTDLLAEAALAFVRARPASAWRLIVWAARGPKVLKNELAARIAFDARQLPYRRDLIEHIAAHRASGGKSYLVTASPQPWAQAVADHLGVFDGASGSGRDRNLKGRVKANYLCGRFGEAGFQYVGDSRADVPVWRLAHSGLGAGAGAARLLGPSAHVFADASGSAAGLLKAVRPHQWLKNLLVFVALFVSHHLTAAGDVLHAALAFVAFSLCASSAYLINDLVDLPVDRLHPRKSRRPFASGGASIWAGLSLSPVMLLAAASLCLLLPVAFTIVLAVYFATTLAYSLALKQRALVDVFTLAALYTLRVIGGAAAIQVPISMWLLAFSMFMFLSLALLKRHAELVDGVARESDKPAGRGYQAGDSMIVVALGIASGFCSVLVMSLYVAQAHVAQLYRTPALLWLICPLLLYWLGRMWLLAQRGHMDDDPIVFTIRDSISRGIILCCGGVAALAALVPLPLAMLAS